MRPTPSKLSPTGGIGVSLRNVCVELGGRDVLRRVTLLLPAGTHALLIGANGAGKSELLKLLAAQRWPTDRPRSTRSYLDEQGATLDLRDVRRRDHRCRRR